MAVRNSALHACRALDADFGKNGDMVAKTSSCFIVQYIAGSDLFSEVVAHEYVVILKRVSLPRTEDCLLLLTVKLMNRIKEYALG